jgi:o-succinylbenzoate synthase
MLRVAYTPYTLQFKRPAATSRGALSSRLIYLLRAWETETPDVAGWGECGPLPQLSRDDWPDFADALREVCDVVNAGYMPAPGDPVDLPSIAFGLEMALRDLQMGGRRQLWSTAFSRGEATLPTHGLIWIDTAEGLLRQVEAKIAAGFRVIKLKVGALPFAEEIALLRTVRRQHPAGSIELRLDANGAWSRTEAMACLEQLAPLAIAFVEQPIAAGQWPALAEICHNSPVPIALDEELIPIDGDEQGRRLLDIVQPQHLILKPALLGGFGRCESWIAEAEARGIGWWINSLLESNLGLNAICQWTSAVGGDRVHGLGTGGLFANNFSSPLQLADARLMLRPELPWDLPAFQ